MNTRKILEALQRGEIKLSDAEAQLKGFVDLGHSRVDLEREERNGIPEVIYGGGKTPEQIIDIMVSMEARGQNILATRIAPEVAVEIIQTYPAAMYHELARLVELRTFEPMQTTEKIAIVCAGTSDLSVAEEARLTAEFYGNTTERVYDCGVAGLHRLLASLDTIRSCRVVVVVAGMEGALPSV
ncbi:MAG: nickel pincer cofactor biosynthesis protein LarB, partial [Verrucomicrobiota bacterium]|nr:nickel pincer cofactor biosynthesis protein LarB [Verrucomicrobiota bacterium]